MKTKLHHQQHFAARIAALKENIREAEGLAACANDPTNARKQVADLRAELAEISWHCGMCGHDSPRRFRSRCEQCGAVKGMGQGGTR